MTRQAQGEATFSLRPYDQQCQAGSLHEDERLFYKMSKKNIHAYISCYEVPILYASQHSGKRHILGGLPNSPINSQELIPCQKTLICHGEQMYRGKSLYSDKHFKSTNTSGFLRPCLTGMENGFQNRYENDLAYFNCTVTHVAHLLHRQATAPLTM